MADFMKAALIRAVKTFCQATCAVIVKQIGDGVATMTDVDWGFALSAGAVAAILSLLTSFATGLPEVPEGEDEEDGYGY